MTISRVSTFAIHQNTLRDANATQARLFDVQRQISSGFKSDNFEGLAGQAESLVIFEAKQKKTQNYIDNNTLIISRLRQYDSSLDQIEQTVDDIQDLFVRRRSVSGDIAFFQQLDGLRKRFVSDLNTSSEGRYLFSGTKTNVKPVIEDPAVPDPVTPGVPDDGYYQGSKEDLTIRAQDNFDIQYNVRADDPAFQKIIAGISLGITGNSENNDDKIAQAEALINEGLQAVIALRTTVNTNLVSLDEINQRHEALKAQFQIFSEEIIKTDVLSASTQVAVDQAVLTATFQSFARITSLRLVDFLS